MIVTIEPSAARGRIEAPPSKSMAHRLLICAGCAAGTSAIHNIDLSEDILATMDCLRALGAEITYESGTATVRGIGLGTEAAPRATAGPEIVAGPGTSPRAAEIAAGPGRAAGNANGAEQPCGAAARPAILDCRECGSTLRFMIPLCLMDGQEYRLKGSERLLARPLTVYEDICAAQGLSFRRQEDCLVVSGRLSPGEYEIPGDISSQFISGLLFVLPLLDGDSRIRLRPPVESRPYIGMTMQAQEHFGVHAEWEDDCTLFVKGGQRYTARDARVEGDYSNAAFFEALNLAGGEVTVEGLSDESLQGDRVYRQYFDKIREGYAEVDLSDCPDLGPVLMAAAALCHGALFTGTRRLKIKESDRGLAMQRELSKMGLTVELRENEIRVPGGARELDKASGGGSHAVEQSAGPRSGQGGCSILRRPAEPLDGHNDHRIVMALAVLLTRTGGSISGAEAVRKSLPDFWERMRELGVDVAM